MLAKSIIAGTVLSLMAGGVVYFGTEIDTAALKETVTEKTADIKAEISDKVMAGGENEHPHGEKTKAPKAESSTDMPSVKTQSGKIIEAKKPTISYSSGSDGAEKKEAEAKIDETKPQKKWLDQYLKFESKDEAETKTVTTETTVTETEEVTEDKTDVAKDLMKSMGLTKDGSNDSETGSFIVEDDSLEAEAEKFENQILEDEAVWVENETSETGRKKATRKMLHDILKKDSAIFVGEGLDGEKKVEVKVIANKDGETTVETETIDMGDGKIMKIVKKTVKSESHDGNGKKMRIKVGTDKDGLDKTDLEAIKEFATNEKAVEDFTKTHTLFIDDIDISSTVKIVMEQAEKIEMPELRDRAYLDLVSYGIEHGNYKVASKALKKIEQVELRDTARNRIAVAHAKDGNAAEAFGILDDIEVEALRDVMRLQVIEAMIAPEELPKDMQ